MGTVFKGISPYASNHFSLCLKSCMQLFPDSAGQIPTQPLVQCIFWAFYVTFLIFRCIFCPIFLPGHSRGRSRGCGAFPAATSINLHSAHVTPPAFPGIFGVLATPQPSGLAFSAPPKPHFPFPSSFSSFLLSYFVARGFLSSLSSARYRTWILGWELGCKEGHLSRGWTKRGAWKVGDSPLIPTFI